MLLVLPSGINETLANIEWCAIEGLNRHFDSGPPLLRDPLFRRPGDNHPHDLRDQEEHDRAAEVFAHGFHVSGLKFERNSHKEGGWRRLSPGVFSTAFGAISFMAFENRLPALERPGLDSQGSLRLRLAGG